MRRLSIETYGDECDGCACDMVEDPEGEYIRLDDPAIQALVDLVHAMFLTFADCATTEIHQRILDIAKDALVRAGNRIPELGAGIPELPTGGGS